MIVGGAILPFSAVLVPEVGRGRERPAFATIAAMRRAARELLALDAELVLLIVPRAAPATIAQLTVSSGDALLARFDEFGEHETEITVDGATTVAQAIVAAELAQLTPASRLTAEAATIVYFIRPALARAALLVLAIEERASPAARTALRETGARLAALPALAARRTAIVVGAELSQRIFPGAPAGYHPDAAQFDEAVRGALTASDLATVERLPPALVAAAAERCLSALSLLRGLLDTAGGEFALLSYQAPFGAGLAVASFTTRSRS